MDLWVSLETNIARDLNLLVSAVVCIKFSYWFAEVREVPGTVLA